VGRINKDVVKDAFESSSVPRREERGRTRRRVIRWFLRILGWYIVVMLVRPKGQGLSLIVRDFNWTHAIATPN
jgi:hypothetical protein